MTLNFIQMCTSSFRSSSISTLLFILLSL